MAVLFRALRPPEYPSMRHEFWLPAQHDTRSQETLATLNAMADALSRKAAAGAQPMTIPIVQLIPYRMIAHRGGAIILDPRKVEQVYSTIKQTQWEEKAPVRMRPVQAKYFVQLALQGNYLDSGNTASLQSPIPDP
uniref:Uncharacterized protein n=1 Tax=Eutreptiella gymnastica TaxID=73025 RepID=A0A6U8LYI7_9EUGL